MDDLERQKYLLQSQFPTHIMVTDIGSGINWKRKGLQTILESAMSRDIEEVVVAHRDRLCRFAFELIQFILENNGVKLIVLDTEDGKSTEQELSEDILSIVHIYSCRSMGRRRYKSKENSSVSNQESKEDNDELDRNC
jgi:predicted site-specific integrase-resolvase